MAYWVFSNSLMIHQVKTKKIKTVKEVWIRTYPILISIDFDEFTCLFTSQFLFRLRRDIKHSRQCFIGYPNTSNFVKTTPLRVIFSILFSVFGYLDETLSLVFDILFILCPGLLYLKQRKIQNCTKGNIGLQQLDVYNKEVVLNA